MFCQSKIKKYLIWFTTKSTAIILDSFLYLIENATGIFISIIDFRRVKQNSNKIVLCRNKYYSINLFEKSMEQYHIDETLAYMNYQVELFFWDADCTLFVNQVKLWFRVRRVNPAAIFFSSYTPRQKRGSVQPSIMFLRKLKLKVNSSFVFLWWDTCSDDFYTQNITRLRNLKAIHLIMDNPELNFGEGNAKHDGQILIPLYTNYVKNSFIAPLDKDLDVVFLGQVSSYRHGRREYVEYLMESNVAGYVSTLDRQHQPDHGKYAEIMGRAKIIINFSKSVNKHQLKGRVFEAMHAGAMLLETDNTQIKTMFQDKVDYVSFSTKEDMVKKIKYYLDNDELRESIASSGRKKVTEFYDSSYFCKAIFDNINIK
jgi:glycosyltransferase involved in cell wall biosynthesis